MKMFTMKTVIVLVCMMMMMLVVVAPSTTMQVSAAAAAGGASTSSKNYETEIANLVKRVDALTREVEELKALTLTLSKRPSAKDELFAVVEETGKFIAAQITQAVAFAQQQIATYTPIVKTFAEETVRDLPKAVASLQKQVIKVATPRFVEAKTFLTNLLRQQGVPAVYVEQVALGIIGVVLVVATFITFQIVWTLFTFIFCCRCCRSSKPSARGGAAAPSSGAQRLRANGAPAGAAAQGKKN